MGFWLCDQQQSKLGGEDESRALQYNWISAITARCAPFIDDIRWEKYYQVKRYYLN